jgi:uncharacterized OsmC-like protein
MNTAMSLESTSAPTAVSTPPNDLDPDALAAAVAGIAENPALGAIAFRARTSWQGRLRSVTEIDGHDLAGQRFARSHRIASDEPLEVFGTDTAPNPQDLLLAALNACMMVGFVVGASTRGIQLESLSIESSIALDLRGVFGIDPSIAPGADRIRYIVRVKGNGTREQFEEIHRDVMATSPNRWHLTVAIPLEPELVIE